MIDTTIRPARKGALCDMCRMVREPAASVCYSMPERTCGVVFTGGIESTFCRPCIIKILEATCEVYH